MQQLSLDGAADVHGEQNGRRCMSFSRALFGVALLNVASVTPGLYFIQPAYAQAAPAGFGSTITPALEVQPGPPPVPLGEPLPRRPSPPRDSRPPLPDYESDADGANLKVGPSVDSPVHGEGQTSGRKAGAGVKRQP